MGAAGWIHIIESVAHKRLAGLFMQNHFIITSIWINKQSTLST